jgi:heme exporter protein D
MIENSTFYLILSFGSCLLILLTYALVNVMKRRSLLRKIKEESQFQDVKDESS